MWPGSRVTAQVWQNKKVPKWQLDKSEMTLRLCFAESKVKGVGWLGAESMNKRVMGGGRDLTAKECDVCALMPVFVWVRVTSTLRTEFGEWVHVNETWEGGQRVQKGWVVLLHGRVFLPLSCSCFTSSRPEVNISLIKSYCVSITMSITAQNALIIVEISQRISLNQHFTTFKTAVCSCLGWTDCQIVRKYWPSWFSCFSNLTMLGFR